MQQVEEKVVGAVSKPLLKQLIDALLASVAESGIPVLPREAYSIEEAAYVCGLGKATIYVLLESHALRGKVLNIGDTNRRTGRTLILREDLQKFLASLPDYTPMRERGRP